MLIYQAMTVPTGMSLATNIIRMMLNVVEHVKGGGVPLRRDGI